MLLFVVFLPLGVMSMMRYGLSLQNSATLWLAVPISTLLAITMLRLRHGLQTLETFSPPTTAPRTRSPRSSCWSCSPARSRSR